MSITCNITERRRRGYCARDSLVRSLTRLSMTRLPAAQMYEQYFNSYLNASIILRAVFCIFNACLIGQILHYIIVYIVRRVFSREDPRSLGLLS